VTWLLEAVLLSSAAAVQTAPDPADAARIDQETLARVLNIRRVFVDRFGGGDTAAQLRDMIISSLQATRLFVITENEERADAILRGSAEDLVFTDTFSSSDSISARTSIGSGSDPDRTASDRRSRYGGASVGENESIRTAERRHEASASIRLVNRNGDVLWSTTQESLGGKFRGAGADVADKIARQLVQDYAKARRSRQTPQK